MEEKKFPDTVVIHNKISDYYKAYHVDGAYGGITPQGILSLSFFAERFPIPKSTEFKVNQESGRIVSKIADSPDSKTGVIREYEAGIYMSLDTAKEIIKLLQTKIDQIEKKNL